MKNYGAKVFKEKRKLSRLLRLARTKKYSAPKLARIFHCDKRPIHGALNRAGIHLPNLGRFKKKYKCSRTKGMLIPDHLASHFIRGVFDGDSSISGKKITHVRFQIAGYKPLLKQIQDVLIKKCSVNEIKLYPTNYRKKVKRSKSDILEPKIFRILDFIYKTIYRAN